MKDPKPFPLSIAAIGQDSHAFCGEGSPAKVDRPLVLGGLIIEGGQPLEGNSDADVVLHALTNALSGLTGQRVLGAAADALCQKGIVDSRAYVRLALASLEGMELTHLSFSIEAKTPHLAGLIDKMRAEIAQLVGLPPARVAITATTGEGLTAYGRGEGIACSCVASALLWPDGSWPR